MGPIVPESRDRIVGFIDSGEAQGAEIRVDGRGLVVPGFENGFFVGPTVIDRVDTSMDVYTNEIFGPVLSVVRVDDVDAAIDLINANPYEMEQRCSQIPEPQHVVLFEACMSAWSISTSLFQYRWHSTHLVGGRIRCLVNTMYMG